MISDRQAALTALGLPDGASDEEVRSAYKRLSMRWHPDKNQNSSEATHMMQQLNAAKDRLEDDDSDDYDSDDESHFYEEDDYYDEDDYYNPFSNGRMDFGAFMRMFAAMHAGGMIDDRGLFLKPPPGFFKKARRGRGGGGFCYCPRCMGMRRPDDREKEIRREQARRQRFHEESAAADARAADEADKHLQQTDPKNSRAWNKGGEHRERLVRTHFLSQIPSLLLHEATDDSLVLLLDVPDVSLVEDGRLPPKGVEWEVCWCAAGDKKWSSLTAPKEYDNIVITKLTPGTEYDVKVRTGLAGTHTWAGSIEWGPWSEPQQIKTSGQPPAAAAPSPAAAAAAGGKKGKKKKKKNRDAAFASLLNQQQQQQHEDSDNEQQQQQQQEEDGHQQQQQQPLEGDLEQQRQQQEEVVEQQQQQQQGDERVNQADPQQQQQQHQRNDADSDGDSEGDEGSAAVVDVEQQQLEEVLGQLQQHKHKKGHKDKKDTKKLKDTEAEQQQQHEEKKKKKKHKDKGLEQGDEADKQQRKEEKKKEKKEKLLHQEAEIQQQQQQQQVNEQELQRLEDKITLLEQQLSQQQQQQFSSDEEVNDGFKTAVYLPRQRQQQQQEEDDSDLVQLHQRAKQQHQQLKLAQQQQQQQQQSYNSSRPGSSRSAGAAAADRLPAAAAAAAVELDAPGGHSILYGHPDSNRTPRSGFEASSESGSDSDESEDLLAAAEAAAAAVEAAEAAGLPIPGSKPQNQKLKPMIMAPCVYYHLGKCKAGNACRFQHNKPSGAAAAAAVAAAAASAGNGGGSSSSSDPDVAKLDALLDGSARSLKQMKEVVELCKKITSKQLEPRYQLKPQEDGSYIPPLFVTAYNVSDDCYAAWYANTVLQGGENTRPNKAKYIALSRSGMKAMFSQAMEDPAPAAAAGSSGVGSSSSSGRVEGLGGMVVHGSKYRTQPCRWFASSGTCRYGDQCQFIHEAVPAAVAESVRVAAASSRADANSEPVLQQQQSFGGSSSSSGFDGVGGPVVHNSKYRTQPCKWYPLGTCRFGDRCQFLHEATPAAAAATSEPGSGAATPREQGLQQQQQSAALPLASSGSAGTSVQQQQGRPQQQHAPSLSQQQQQRFLPYHQQQQQHRQHLSAPPQLLQQQQRLRPPPAAVPLYPAVRPGVQGLPPFGYAAAGYPGVQAAPMIPQPYGFPYGPVRYKQV